MLKLVIEKAKETEIKLTTFAGSSKKQESSRKASTFALLTVPKPLTVWITTRLYAENILLNAGLDEAQTEIKIAGEISITSVM